MRTRLFQVMGNIYELPAVATIVINGQQVFQGSLTGNLKNPNIHEEQTVICSGQFTFDDFPLTETLIFPVTVTLTSGRIDLGLFLWNWGFSVIPGTNPPEYTQNENTYGAGPKELNFSNRTNVLVNGDPLLDAGTNVPIMMNAGDVVTFDQIIFSPIFSPVEPTPPI